MSYGFIVKNTENEIVVDGEYSNYCLSESGIVTGINYTLQSLTYPVNYTNTGIPPIVAFKSGSSYRSIRSNNSITQGQVFAQAPDGVSIPYKVFRKLKNSDSSSPGYGISVFNPASELVFTSNKRFLRIATFHSFTSPLMDQSIDITVNDAVNNYFVVSPLSIGMRTIPYSFIYFYATMICTINPTTIRVSYTPFFGDPYDHPDPRTSGHRNLQTNLIEVNDGS